MPTTGDPNSYFNLTTGSFWVMAGDIVTMTDGDITKTQVIPDIEVGLGEDDVNIVDEDGDSTYVPGAGPSSSGWTRRPTASGQATSPWAT